MSLMGTPRANRLHIGLFGQRNSGKSSLLNAISGQQAALVSSVPGTTADPVYKAMEVAGIGACTFIDTAGFDDEGDLGELRVERTKLAACSTDIALLLFSGTDMAEELKWLEIFRKANTPVIAVVSRADTRPDGGREISALVRERTGLTPVVASAVTRQGLDGLHLAIIRAIPADYELTSITGDLCAAGDTVLLVMPQDIQAPKGRLILPQVQTIRDLLDKHCIVVSAAAGELAAALGRLKEPPQLIITDSQAFAEVYRQKPPTSKLTSFSVLFANYKGDIDFFRASAEKIATLPPTARILIAEACTHKPLAEDIGRVKLPRLLKKKFGPGLAIDIVSGQDFPTQLTGYDMVIHCGACMFNRKYVLARAACAKTQQVPMTNYGLALAFLSGILDKVTWPSTGQNT